MLYLRLASLLFLMLTFSDQILADQGYLNQLILKSRELKLASDPQWLNLVHYQEGKIASDYRSLAVSKAFFNAEDGFSNPQSELEASLTNFFNPEGRIEAQSQEPYHCAFRARFIWLDQKLNFDKSKIPLSDCSRFNKWFSAINGTGLTLIFPSAYINNPASAFGHTLLRIDQLDQNEKNRLLAYTANFAAETGGEDGFSYAFKGVFGGYDGYFSVAPYYEKVKLYSDMENRDIWEYPLNFSQEETNFLLAHLWELRSIGFPYYYFDQNCSYYLLKLLEAVRPSLKLSEEFPSWVIPIDSVRTIIDRKAQNGAAVFRPSSITELQTRISSNSVDNQKIAKGLAKGELELSDKSFQSLNQIQQAHSIDLAYEYLNFQIVAGKDPEKLLEQRAYSLLLARSRLPEVEKTISETPAFQPEQGHLSSKISLGTGIEDKSWFYETRLRPAYHDLLDNAPGFAKGAQIELFDLVLRHYESNDPKLERAMLLDIKSFSPRNEFIKPVSWNLDLGLQRIIMPEDQKDLAFQLNAGVGTSWNLTDNIFLYSLVDFNNLSAEDLDNGFATGIGPKAGLIFKPYDYWQINPTFSFKEFLFGDRHTSLDTGIDQSFRISTNLALRLKALHQRSFGQEDNTISLSFDLYL